MERVLKRFSLSKGKKTLLDFSLLSCPNEGLRLIAAVYSFSLFFSAARDSFFFSLFPSEVVQDAGRRRDFFLPLFR